jgi:Carboxypeptidase regulatory-like domain/IPT/TIG domain/Dockerin type I domain
MKRVVQMLLIVILAVADPNGAAAKQRTPEGSLVSMAQSGAGTSATRVSPEQQADGYISGGESQGKKKKSGRIGPPVATKLTKASGRKFDLRKLPQIVPASRRETPRPLAVPVMRDPIMAEPEADTPFTLDASRVRNPVANAAAPAPILTFDGLDRESWGDSSPSESTGDAGPDWYIQAVSSSVGIYRKTDGFREAAFSFDTLMSEGDFGNLCDTDNAGNPVVLYDTFEDRWILTDTAFATDGGGNAAGPAYQCFAVSMNGDPLTGGWNFYSIEVPDRRHDYAKLGVWTDGIYMSANLYSFGASPALQGVRAWAINKFQMYAGTPDVQIVTFDVSASDFSVLPANARLQTGTPPPGTPNFFISTWNFLNAVSVYQFKVDWNSVALSTFTGPDVPLAATTWPNATVAGAPQPGTTTLLNVMNIQAMPQNQYTNLGGVESLWVPHTVRRANTTGFAAPRWYQVNVTGGAVAAALPQAATWDPDGANVLHRFMPSLAIDRAGNMALSYSTSSSTEFPSIRYAGRLASDPVNTFSQTEQSLFTGTASQTTSTTWGRSSSVMLDPDGCTFWVTNQYANPASQDADKLWKTHIGAFRYAECTTVGAGGTISGTVTATPGGAPLSGATVQLGVRSAVTNGSGVYSFTNIPAGTYPSISATLAGYESSSASSIVVDDGATATQDFALALAPASACLVDTSQADFQEGALTNVSASSPPGDLTLLDLLPIDQQNKTLGTQGAGFNAVTWLGQTFTAATSGPIVRVDLNLFSLNCGAVTMPNITVAIRAAAANLPSGPDLATATISGFCNGAGGWFTANFATPFSVIAGTQYALVWRAVSPIPAGTPAPGYFGSVSAGTGAITVQNPYAGGRRTSSSNAGTTWAGAAGNANNDHGFVVYVDQGYATAGTFVSSIKDSNPLAGLTPIWDDLTWNGTTPANTTLRLQVAASSSSTGPFDFVGPDGTDTTYFTSSPVPLSQFLGFRYLHYKAYLDTSDTDATPALHDVTVCYANVDCSGPAPAITPAPAEVCASSTGNTASTVAGMTSYAWSIVNGTITGGVTSQTVTYTAGTSGTVELLLTVTESNGCVKDATQDVTINPIPEAPLASNAGPFCENATITLSTPAVSGATYAWSGPGGFTSSEREPSIANATSAKAGTYSVTITVNGCTSAAGETEVVVDELPATPEASNDGPFCEATPIALSTPAVSGATYAWTGPGGFTSSDREPTRSNATVAMAGTYFVTITVDGCTSAAGNTEVVVTPAPATPAASNGGPYCENATIALSTPAVSGATYAWTGPGGFISSDREPARTNATTAMSGTYSVTVTVDGCTSLAGTTNVAVNTIPSTPAASNGGPFCETGTITLNTPVVTGATYAWTGPGGFVSSDRQATRSNATSAMAGTYSVTITVDGCTSAAGSTNVVVTPAPATPAASNGGPYCENATIGLSTPAVSGATYAWTGPGGFTSSDREPARNNATTAMAGTYSVTVTVDGCTSLAGTTNVVVNAIPATPTASNGGPFCENATITLGTSAVSGATYAWTGPGGFTSSDREPARTNATMAMAGTYSVTITVDGCTSLAGTTNVVVNTIPSTPTASNGGPFCENATVTLSTPLVTGATYAWTGPDGFTSSDREPARSNATPAMSGSYSVTVTVNGCTSAAGSTNVVVNAVPATPAISGATSFCPGGSVTLTSSAATGNQWYRNGVLLDGFTQQTYVAGVAGDYTVTATSSGCTSSPSAATTVTANPAPDATITVASSIVSGGSGTASVADAGAGATYAWVPGNGTITAGPGTRSITFTAGAAGTLTLDVTVVSGASCSDTGQASVAVTDAPPPVTITSVAPGSASRLGGTGITITGTGFLSGATVTVGGTAATNVVVVSATQITATTPAHAPGTVDVTVTNTDSTNATLAGALVILPQQFDANGDGVVDPSDIFYLVNYLFTSGPPPAGAAGLSSGDANGDGAVDPADIFYVVSYLFAGGPEPHATTPRTSVQAATEAFGGSLTLGTPYLRGNRHVVPVIFEAAAGGTVPQAISLKVRVQSGIAPLAVRRAGAAAEAVPMFEISRIAAGQLSYLVAFDQTRGALAVSGASVIAEIELPRAAFGRLELDPAVTLVTDASGTRKATVANGALRVAGTTIPRPERERPTAGRGGIR